MYKIHYWKKNTGTFTIDLVPSCDAKDTFDSLKILCDALEDQGYTVKIFTRVYQEYEGDLRSFDEITEVTR